MTIQKLATIRSYHAHVYFDGPEQRRQAEALREEIGARFSVRLGRWHDHLVGPHTRPMYQVSFAPGEFPRLVPWLMINRRGLAVLIHPNTGQPKADHLLHALWLGEILDLDAAPLPELDEAPEPAIELNTDPKLTP
ncbi:DOPA 4,5-dioxygenase family protein [Dongia sp.]|uniref:DOPA 4,5-dioxygenase family protein n=1 Tax=Dongia sp. TaxID=1977262 RepID=UPI0037513D03